MFRLWLKVNRFTHLSVLYTASPQIRGWRISRHLLFSTVDSHEEKEKVSKSPRSLKSESHHLWTEHYSHYPLRTLALIQYENKWREIFTSETDYIPITRRLICSITKIYSWKSSTKLNINFRVYSDLFFVLRAAYLIRENMNFSQRIISREEQNFLIFCKYFILEFV